MGILGINANIIFSIGCAVSQSLVNILIGRGGYTTEQWTKEKKLC